MTGIFDAAWVAATISLTTPVLFAALGETIAERTGTIDVGLSLWLPGGGIDHMGHRREQKEMIDSKLEVGPVTYEMLEPMRRWRLTAPAPTCKAAQPVQHAPMTPARAWRCSARRRG